MSKQVTIRSVKIEGFRSYISPVIFPFGVTGLHLIKGGNGEGKTTIFSALCWCLYKINLNNSANAKVATWKHKRPKKWLGTRVVVILGIGRYKYMIARHIDYKGKTAGIEPDDSLMIFKKEKLDKNKFNQSHLVNDELYKVDQQAYLIKLLGIDGKTFINSVVFGQRLERLMSSKAEDKRNLFESLFDVDFIEGLKEKANVKLADTNMQVFTHEAYKGRYEDRIRSLNEQIEMGTTLMEEFTKTRKENLAVLRAQHSAKIAERKVTAELIAQAEQQAAKIDASGFLNVLLEEADKKREAHSEVKQRLSSTRIDHQQYAREITRLTLQGNKLAEELKQVKVNCPYCGTLLDAKQVAETKKKIKDSLAEVMLELKANDKRAARLTASIENITKELEAVSEEFSTAMQAYDEAKQQNINTNSGQTELSTLQQKYAILEQAISSLAEQHAKEKERKAPTIDIEALRAKVLETTELLAGVLKDLKKWNNLYIRLTWWIKNAFSAGGLKAYVFSAMLNRLNECLFKYTSYFGYTVSFGVDLTKPSKPFYGRVTMDGKNEVDYIDLSGGQKQKIDVCIAFALSDIIEIKTSFNILLLDEISEGLDVAAQEMLDMLIRIKAETKAVYIISHNPQMDLSGAVEYEVKGGNGVQSSIS